MSRNEDEDDVLMVVLDPKRQTKRRMGGSDLASATSHLFALVCPLHAQDAYNLIFNLCFN